MRVEYIVTSKDSRSIQDLCPYDAAVASDKGSNKDTDKDGILNICDNCPGKLKVQLSRKRYNNSV